MLERREYLGESSIKKDVSNLLESAFPIEERPPTKYFFKSLEKKENKLLRYRCQKENQDISEYWLFICNPSNTFCDLEDFEMPDFESSFDRIYITDIRRVLQLK